MFKVGDWVRNTKLNRVFQYSYSDLKYDLANQSHCKDDELWLPKEGEWVVCVINSIKNMFSVFQYEKDIYDEIKDMNPDDIVTIQPFVGQLPSDLKENR